MTIHHVAVRARTSAWRTTAPPRIALTMSAIAALAVATLRRDPYAAFAIAGLVVVGTCALCIPGVLLVLAFPVVFAFWRVATGGIDLSVADLVTVLALAVALPFAPWRNRDLRAVLFALLTYLALLSVCVLATPSARAFGEWPHRAVLFGGAVLIGAVVARRGLLAAGLRAFVVAATIVAVAAVVDAFTSGFDPAQPFNMHKNAAGPLFAIGALLLMIVPERLELPRTTTSLLLVPMLAGLAATQSRGAVLAFGAVMALNAVRRTRGRGRRASVLALLAMSGLIVVSVTTLREEATDDNRFNPVQSREEDYRIAMHEVWSAHPIAGGGLKWFRERGDNSGPHNIAIAELSEAGIVGFTGLVVLLGTTTVLLARRRDSLGRAAFSVFIFELFFALSGIFWLAGTLTMPMLVVGLAIGDSEAARARARAVSPAPAAR